MFVPFVLIVIGVVSLLNAMGVITANWEVVWPLLLIVLGFHMMHRKGGHCGCGMCGHCKTCNNCQPETTKKPRV